MTLYYNATAACPVNNWQLTTQAASLVSPSNLVSPVTENGALNVKPTDPAIHALYTFYLKLTALGGSVAYHGPFRLDVGCTTTSVTFADDENFVTTGVPKWVGDPGTAVYTLLPPSSTLPYCTVTSNIVVAADGSTPHTKINNCASQP